MITTSGDLRARKVILAMGRRGTPRRLGVPGEEAANVFYDIVEMETFRGRRVLVVGGGDSAVESALGLANQPDGAEVTLSYRGNELKRVKERNRAKLEAQARRGPDRPSAQQPGRGDSRGLGSDRGERRDPRPRG